MNAMRFTLEEAKDALQTAINQNYSEMVMTGEELRQCTAAIESIDKCLREDDEAEATAQRARDKCIGAHGYDLNKLTGALA